MTLYDDYVGRHLVEYQTDLKECIQLGLSSKRTHAGRLGSKNIWAMMMAWIQASGWSRIRLAAHGFPQHPDGMLDLDPTIEFDVPFSKILITLFLFRNSRDIY